MIDEFLIIGEFMFVFKKLDDFVIGGIINQNGFLLVQVIYVGQDMILV